MDGSSEQFGSSRLLYGGLTALGLVAFFVVASFVHSSCSQPEPIWAGICPRLAVTQLSRRSSNVTSPTSSAEVPTLKPHMVQISTRPRVFLVEDVVTAAEAKAIIATARPHLERSRTGGAPSKKEGSVSDVRTSLGMFMVTQPQIALVVPIAERVSKLTGIPVDHFEAMQVLRYEAGQQYHPHPDYFDGELLASVQGHGGNRIATIIMYLNEVEVGGETNFPLANITVKPKTGGGVLFWSMNEDGSMETRSLHAGRPVGPGAEKWVSVYWLREATIR